MSKKPNYTDFPNKIGLFVNENDEVVLNFPYKDCVLEAGMTKEDAKRPQEYFLHNKNDETDIATLFAPKNFTNFKKIDNNGEKPLTENDEIEFWDENGDLKQNLLVKWNNLVALHSLATRLAGKVKLIYIDPPYNTENDEFSYNDNFKRSTWLTFMKNRLEAARDLLSEDGSIYVNIDYNEAHYLKILMDEIFWENNFQREIIWRIGWVSGYKTAVKNFVRNHDTLFFYSKNKEFLKFNKYYIQNEDFKELVKFEKTKDIFKKYNISKDVWKNIIQEINYDTRPDRYPIEDVWNANEYDDLNSIAIVSFSWESVSKMIGNWEIKGQKSEKLIQRIIEASTNPWDLVLDYHLGSGTTAAVAHKMGRRWIGIEQMDYIDTIAKERLKKVIDGEQGGISKSVSWQGGGDFVYFELKTFNADFAHDIESATTKTRLNEIYQDMKRSAFLKFFFDPKEFESEETEEGKKYSQLSLEDQKIKLLEVLDMNHIYLNFENNVPKHDVSEMDKFLTKKFYGKDKNEQ